MIYERCGAIKPALSGVEWACADYRLRFFGSLRFLL
jgi:hypothetical protein